MTPQERLASELQDQATKAFEEARKAQAALVAERLKIERSAKMVREFLAAFADRMVMGGQEWDAKIYRDWLGTFEPEAQLLNHCRKSLLILTDPILGVSNIGDGRLAWNSKTYKDLHDLHHGYDGHTGVDTPFLVFNGLIRAIVAGLDTSDPVAVTRASLDAIKANLPLPEPNMDELTVTDALYVSGLLGFQAQDMEPWETLVSAWNAREAEDA